MKKKCVNSKVINAMECEDAHRPSCLNKLQCVQHLLSRWVKPGNLSIYCIVRPFSVEARKHPRFKR